MASDGDFVKQGRAILRRPALTPNAKLHSHVVPQTPDVTNDSTENEELFSGAPKQHISWPLLARCGGNTFGLLGKGGL
jgi:hypothetical protein